MNFYTATIGNPNPKIFILDIELMLITQIRLEIIFSHQLTTELEVKNTKKPSIEFLNLFPLLDIQIQNFCIQNIELMLKITF